VNWHTLEVKQVLSELQADPIRGLSLVEVESRRSRYGRNILPEAQGLTVFQIFVHQFKSPLIYLLLFAAVAAFSLQEFSDGVVILFVVLLNAIIGSIQESRAEKSLQALRQVSSILVRTHRDGEDHTLPAAELVPGDIVHFLAGDAVPADVRLIESAALEMSEAVLTGESMPVAKQPVVIADEKAALGDRLNMLYSGTFVTAGRAKGVVVRTGVHTEIGKIAKLTGTVSEPPTTLTLKIAHFSRNLMYASGIIFCFIIFVGWLQGISFKEIVMIAISQIVSIIPEGLPVAITVAAAVGVQRMAARKTIVRKLSAVETLGSTSVICSDKTGTLTLNRMTVTEIRTLDKTYQWGMAQPETNAEVSLLLKMASLCNDAAVKGEEGLGDPTETSLLIAAQKVGLRKSELDHEYPRVGEIPFDSQIKMMATQHTSSSGESFVALKGAPDNVLELCQLDPALLQQIKQQNEEMASQALRVLAIAWAPAASVGQGLDGLKGQVKFLGLVGQMDPPREEVKEAIANCRTAGIRPVMITGDHKTTGFAIAKLIGLAQPGDIAVEGKDLDENLELIHKVAVFARVHPSQKLQIVEALQEQGQVVAMTGDGVNDAPALSKADVGVAMGITGTEVAKEASKIVITDDNFTTIVTAIAEGRLVYQNIKKVILLLFSTSVAEVVVLLMALILGFAAPYYAVQILWANLVTQGVITINLIMEPAEGTEMQRSPIPKHEPLITPDMINRMLFIVPSIVLSTFGWFIYRTKSGLDLDLVRTETLTMLVVCQWFNVLNCRSSFKSSLSWGILRNHWLIGGLLLGNILHILVVFWQPLGQYFHTVPVDLSVVPQIALVGSIVFWVEEARKLYVRTTAA
jgi:calcium-translocating P-type ATPase